MFPRAGPALRPYAPSGPDSGIPAGGCQPRRPGTRSGAVRRAWPLCPPLARPGRPEVAVTAAEGRHELDQAAGVERASIRHRVTRRAAPVGGSNRLLSVEELAAYLGVPTKTVDSCWR